MSNQLVLLKQSSWDIKNEKIEKTDAQFEQIFGWGTAEPVDWRPYAPSQEDQRRTVYCLIFSYLNALEMMAKKGGVDVNLAERWLVAGLLKKGLISSRGTNFNYVAQEARERNLVKEEACPFETAWLEAPWNYEAQIKDVSGVPADAKRFSAPNYSWVSTSITGLKNALASTPLWVGVGLGSTYTQQDRVITKPSTYSSYHGVVMEYIDDKYKYIYDSVQKAHKRFALDYPILFAKSFKKLPLGWQTINQETNNMEQIELKRVEGKKKVYGIKDGEKYWFVSWKEVERWAGYDSLKEAQEAVQEVTEGHLDTYPLGGVIGNPSFWDWSVRHSEEGLKSRIHIRNTVSFICLGSNICYESVLLSIESFSSTL